MSSIKISQLDIFDDSNWQANNIDDLTDHVNFQKQITLPRFSLAEADRNDAQPREPIIRLRIYRAFKRDPSKCSLPFSLNFAHHQQCNDIHKLTFCQSDSDIDNLIPQNDIHKLTFCQLDSDMDNLIPHTFWHRFTVSRINSTRITCINRHPFISQRHA